MLLVDLFIEAFEKLLEAITPGAPPPQVSVGKDPSCVRRNIEHLGSNNPQVKARIMAAIEALTKMYPDATTWWAASTIKIDRGYFPEEYEGAARRSSPGSGYDFEIDLNVNRTNPTYFDMAAALIHELAHVNLASSVGFFPYEVATLTSDVEYIALEWEFEYLAYTAMLDGAREIYNTDKDKYRKCWNDLINNKPVLTELNAGNSVFARGRISLDYDEDGLRNEWINKQGGPAPSVSLLADWNYYRNFHSPSLKDLATLITTWQLDLDL